jgi:hypothetical protein
MAMTETRRGVEHYRAGPHLPAGPAIVAVLECFRCADDRRRLREYAVGHNGRTIGYMQLCDGCAGDLIPLERASGDRIT